MNSINMQLIKHSDASTFELTRIPFSYHGSWNSISIPKDKDGLWFCHHHRGGGSLFPLIMIRDGERVDPEITATPALLTLRNGNGVVEICFENEKTVRFRGKNIGFMFGERELAYCIGENLFALNKPFDRRYQIELFKGSGTLHQLVPTQPVFPRTLEIVPDENGDWEVAVDKYASTWVRPERPSFDECLAATTKAFDAFLAAMPPVREQDKHTHRKATYVNWGAVVEPSGLIKRPSLFMSKFTMCNVWSWDHAFNALALSAGHPELALDQMLTMVDHQDEFGCYPDSINDLTITYNFSKPPVHGWIFSEMLKRLPERPSADVMETMYRSLSAQANWWMTHRVMEGERLPYYLHGNDSGWDNSTMFKLGVPLEAPDLSALLTRQMDCLADLATTLGKTDEATDWKRRADELFGYMMDELRDGGQFVPKHGITGETGKTMSLVPWLAIILGERLPQSMRDCMKQGIERHLTDWGLATERVDSPLYIADGYWMGPIWAPATFIAIAGLDDSGFSEFADEVAQRFCNLADKSDFAENYNAVTGEPLCCPAYTWTSSVYILLAERLNKECCSCFQAASCSGRNRAFGLR